MFEGDPPSLKTAANPTAAETRKLPPMAMDDDYADGPAAEDDEKLMLTISIPGSAGGGGGADRRKMSVCNMPPETIDGIDYVDETPQPSPTHLSPDENTAVIVHDMQDDDESGHGGFHDHEGGRYEKVSVPVYVCLLVVFGYIIGGSVLFASWEGWELLDGAYFWWVILEKNWRKNRFN